MKTPNDKRQGGRTNSTGGENQRKTRDKNAVWFLADDGSLSTNDQLAISPWTKDQWDDVRKELLNFDDGRATEIDLRAALSLENMIWSLQMTQAALRRHNLEVCCVGEDKLRFRQEEHTCN